MSAFTIRVRVDKLESHRDRQDGGRAFADTLVKYGPFFIALVTALFIVLIATKRIAL